MGELIHEDTRLFVTAESGGPPPDWYQPAWDVYFDTPYSFDSIEAFSCELNRGSMENPLFLLNHWVEDPLPDPDLSAQANTLEVLGGRAEQCQQETGHIPNMVAVNHYEEGALFKVVDQLNGF